MLEGIPNLVRHMIESIDWKPMDMDVTVKLIQDLLRNEFGDEDKSQILKMENWPFFDDRNHYLKISNIQATLRTYILMESFPLSLHKLLLGIIV